MLSIWQHYRASDTLLTSVQDTGRGNELSPVSSDGGSEAPFRRTLSGSAEVRLPVSVGQALARLCGPTCPLLGLLVLVITEMLTEN